MNFIIFQVICWRETEIVILDNKCFPVFGIPNKRKRNEDYRRNINSI